jgi:hypothetical protein
MRSYRAIFKCFERNKFFSRKRIPQVRRAPTQRLEASIAMAEFYEQGRRTRARDRGIRNEQDPAARSPLGSRGWKIIYPEKRRLESEKEKPESKTRSGF